MVEERKEVEQNKNKELEVNKLYNPIKRGNLY